MCQALLGRLTCITTINNYYLGSILVSLGLICMMLLKFSGQCLAGTQQYLKILKIASVSLMLTERCVWAIYIGWPLLSCFADTEVHDELRSEVQ